MSFLYLHIGHEKTGTTAVQSFLASNRERLRSAGFRYPEAGDDARIVNRALMVPVGNGRGLLDTRKILAASLERHGDGGRSHVVFSSETMFERIAGPGAVDFLPDTASAAGFAGVKVLLMTRNPIGHGTSTWHQRVKGWQGERMPLDTWLAHCYQTPADVVAVMSRLSALDRVDVTVRNYSQCHRNVLTEVSNWLALPRDLYLETSRQDENRSLTAGEVLMQLRLNEALGPSGQLFALRATAEVLVPDPQRLTPSKVAQDEAWNRLLPSISNVNTTVDDVAKYSFDAMEPVAHQDGFVFTAAQLALIAEGMADEIQRLRRTSISYHVQAVISYARRAARAAAQLGRT